MKSLTALVSWFALITQAFITILILFTASAIPTHWSLSGTITDVGSPWWSVLVMLITIAVYVGLTWLENRPEKCNFPRKYNDESLAMKVMEEFIGVIKMFVILILTDITIEMWGGNSFNMIIMGILVVGLLYSMYHYIRKLSKA